jgi:DNA-binding ferritin-like protein
MAEILNPSGMMMSGYGGGDGGLGFGGGGGLIGGLILGSLLRQGNGGLFGGGNGGDGAAVLRSPPEQSSANMALMQSIGQVDKAVAVGTAAMEASQANQSIGLTNQFNATTGSLATRVDGVKEAVNANAVTLMQQLNTVNTNLLTGFNQTQSFINNDGDKTRALITQQYEATLNRQLTDANAAVIALQNRFENAERARGIEVNTTTTVNQMQQQSQQQQQYGQLYNAIWGLSQSIRSTNEAINVGSGTLTANPANTNTNIR